MNSTALVIFLLTYVLASTRGLERWGLERPTVALLGALACVLFGVLDPTQALASIDGSTLLLLFGMMGLGAFLALDGFFDHVESRLVQLARTPSRLLAWIVFGAGVTSALVTNDAVCVLGAPVVVRLIRRHQLPPLPFLLALATSANTGSVATLVGNPQNMLCASLGHLNYLDHLLVFLPLAAVCLLINFAFLRWAFRAALARARLELSEAAPLPLASSSKTTLFVIVGTALAYSLGGHLAWTAVGAFGLLIVLQRRLTRDLWAHVDWSLLLFFGGLFVVVRGFDASGVPDWLFRHFPLLGTARADSLAAFARLSTLFLVGSNIVSNVPFILVIEKQMLTLPDPRWGWELLAMASTFAGNLTLLGSVANVIVAEAGREVGGIGFVDYAKIGAPLALLTTALGTLWIHCIAG